MTPEHKELIEKEAKSIYPDRSEPLGNGKFLNMGKFFRNEFIRAAEYGYQLAKSEQNKHEDGYDFCNER